MLDQDYAIIMNYNGGLRFIKLPNDCEDVEEYITYDIDEDLQYDADNESFTCVSRFGMKIIRDRIINELNK